MYRSAKKKAECNKAQELVEMKTATLAAQKHLRSIKLEEEVKLNNKTNIQRKLSAYKQKT